MSLDAVDSYVHEVAGRSLPPGEWGLSVECAGAPLEIGLRARRGLLRAQAWAAPAGVHDPLTLLHRNRALELVRYACTKAGDVWVVGEVPLDGAPVDRLLGALADAAAALR
jgi:hypothetical protein